MTLTYLSCFSGIGGLDLGFDRAGLRCVGQIELDKHARSVLDRHWPEVPKHDDITTAIGWADELGLRGRVDIVAGGAPCQDLSVAGKRAGLAGDRSRLVLDMVALAAHLEARWIVYENVPGLLSSNQGRDFGVLISEMADAGFPHVEWRVLNAQHFGVAQRRRRIFVVASTAARSGRPVLLEREGCEWHPSQGQQAGQESAGAAGAGFAGRSPVAALTANGLGGGGPDDNLAQAGHLVPALALASSSMHADSSQHRDHGHRGPVRPRHRVAGGDIVGTLSGGAHPGGFNGQDAYLNQLVVVDESTQGYE